MLILPIREAEAGMRLAAPVTHPSNPKQTLLRQGYVLKDNIIERMRSFGISFVYVDHPELDFMDRHLEIYLSPARQEVYYQIKRAISLAQRKTHPGIPYEAYCNTTRELIVALLTQGQNPIYLEQMSRQGSEAVSHAAAVAHLSLLLGLKLESYLISEREHLPRKRARDVVNLGVAAMLHDLGVSRLAGSLRRHCELDSPDDPGQCEQWQVHPLLGYSMIHGQVGPSAAAAVYQHHQHFDGSGFPALKDTNGERHTLSGHRIHVFARIVLCANLFDRLASPPGYTGRRSNLEVLTLMRRQYAGWYDPVVFRALQMIAPPFPPGYRVRLSDGTAAVVTDVNPGSPTRPIVRRLASDDWTLVGSPVDLRDPLTPQIQRALCPEPLEPVGV